MTKYVILGASGMLGKEFINLLEGLDVVGYSKNECDVTSIEQLEETLSCKDIVINCSGWTAVDKAEEHESEAFAINATAVANMATICAKNGSRLIHFSTDYVFSGESKVPYQEDSPTEPKSAYGRTKLSGELAINRIYPNGSYIVRTAWLYGEFGPNFVKTMIELEAKNQSISVVCDQFGQPTWARDLAKKVIQLIEIGAPLGIYHGTSSGQTTWFEFAQKIFSLIGADPQRVKPISSNEYSRPAKRPDYSVLGHKRWEEARLSPIQNWEKAIEQAFDENVF